MTTKIHTLHGCSWCYNHWHYYRADYFNRCGTNSGDFDRGFRCVYPTDKEPITGLGVLLGGSCGNCAYYFRAHSRLGYFPERGNYYFRGFRCVYSVKSND